jgi:hypothetical protein
MITRLLLPYHVFMRAISNVMVLFHILENKKKRLCFTVSASTWIRYHSACRAICSDATSPRTSLAPACRPAETPEPASHAAARKIGTAPTESESRPPRGNNWLANCGYSPASQRNGILDSPVYDQRSHRSTRKRRIIINSIGRGRRRARHGTLSLSPCLHLPAVPRLSSGSFISPP